MTRLIALLMKYGAKLGSAMPAAPMFTVATAPPPTTLPVGLLNVTLKLLMPVVNAPATSGIVMVLLAVSPLAQLTVPDCVA